MSYTPRDRRSTTNPALRPDGSSPIKYRSLDWSKFEVRFLSIKPSPLGPDIVNCQLRHGTLLNPPEYVALSYAWGDPGVTAPTIINDELVQVNLAAALKELASRRISLVWIDALCINQSDLYERSHQVSRMGQIYATATKVVAWLGPASPTSDIAMRYLQFDGYADTRRQKFANYVKANYLLDAFDPMTGQTSEKVGVILQAILRNQTNRQHSQHKMNALLEIEQSADRDSGIDVESVMDMDFEAGQDIFMDIANNNDPLQSMWRALTEFLERPYWSRSWIVQELAKGKEVEIWCGDKHLSFDDLTGALQDPLFHAHTTMIENLNHFRLREKQSRIGVARMLLSEALVRTFPLKATDPIDKVYAILGLTLDGPDAVPTPNYTQDPSEVFRQVFEFIIATEGQTSMLLLAGKRQDIHGIPSWLPWLHSDGTTMYGSTTDSIKQRVLASDLLPSDLPDWVVECVRLGRETFTFSTQVETGGLRVKGVLLTHLSNPVLERSEAQLEVSRKPYRGNQVDEDQVLRTMLDLWKFLVTGLTKPDSDDPEEEDDPRKYITEDRQVLVKRFDTLVAAFLGLYGEEATETVVSLHRWYRKHKTWFFFDHTVEKWVDCYRKGISKASDFTLVDISTQNSHYELHALHVGVERLSDEQIQTTLTRDGAFRLVHRAALQGDGIWRLENCALPVDLRRRKMGESQYSVIGEAVMPIRADFQHRTEDTGWTGETFAPEAWQTITIV
ncbi:hypothetical protein PRZ48_006860 [Zasmidium cellare]|uniref:Heterokaryon incompatibility domain-containing protein n=1 Tax=Zasmidium cellare TaxID=395010 RepID=A0ABR0EHU4_ZASCE|nr:hypothetical protein PRZ48_006860 [Zasmidium cellare]